MIPRSLLVVVTLVGCSASPGPDASKTQSKVQPQAEGKPEAEAEGKPAAEAEGKPEAKPQPVHETIFVPPPVPGPPPEAFEADDGRYGYRDAGGEIVLAPTYAMAMPFVDQVAGVATDEGWIFIDRTGRKLAKAFVLDNAADDFVEDRARIVTDDGHYGFIASTGRVLEDPTWSFVERFSGGLAAVCEGCVREQDGEHFTMKGGKWGYVDATGKVVVPPRFAKAEPFVDGRASVSEGGRDLVIGPTGEELAP